MERLMLLCDSCVRTGIKMVTVMSIPIKKRIPNSFIKKENFYFFLSCHSAKNNRRGNIGFCKEADNRASCLHCEWQESSYQFARGVMVGPLSPDWLLPGRALSSFLSFFSPLPPFFPPLLPSLPPSLSPFLLVAIWSFLTLTQHLSGLRDQVPQPSLWDSSCQARSKDLVGSCRL